MPEYRRLYFPGGTFFFTLVTYETRPIFANEGAGILFYEILEKVSSKLPFDTVAFSLLPEHFHGIWKFPEGDSNYSLRLSEIKRQFSHRYLREIEPILEKSSSRFRRGAISVWQRRFLEHTIRDEKDLFNHIDYIHYNPVKHGLVRRVCDWKDSSFNEFMNQGLYDIDWGEGEVEKKKLVTNFGE
jgi:putative transposase